MPDEREKDAAATIETIDPRAFKRTIITDPADCGQVRLAVRDYRIMLLSVLDAMLERYERDPDYHFIDTKLRTADGAEFDEDDPLRGKGTIYTWIQGRGLEALASHESWIRRCPAIAEPLRADLSSRIRATAAEVLEQMERMCLANGGHLAFTMSPSGEPLRVTADGKIVEARLSSDAPSNYGDIFYAKGMAAAAAMLGDSAKLAEARRRFELVDRDIRQGRFQSEESGSQGDAGRPQRRKHMQGPWMIAIGAAARFLEITGDSAYRRIGLEYIEHILARHVDTDGTGGCCRRYDVWECVDDDGQPYVDEDGVLLSNPGHSIEIAGLGLEFTRICKRQESLEPAERERIERIEEILPHVLERNLSNGFSGGGVGITYEFDLISRRILGTELPWWPLPEAMRAAVESCRAAPRERRGDFARLAADCSNAFLRYYVRPDVHLWAVQTLDGDGCVSQKIPATPDADPGYHTGVSIIGCLDVLAADLAKT